MMAQNFVGGNTRDTKYLDAQLAGAASVQNMQNSMSASLMSSLGAGGTSLGAGESSVEEYLAEAMFYAADPQLRNAKLLKDTTDAHRELFAETNAEIDAKAEEAMAPKDENGDPIEQVGQSEHASDTSSKATPAKASQDSAASNNVVKNKEDAAEKAAKEIEALDIKVQ